MKRVALLAPLLLTACFLTPQEQCIHDARKDYVAQERQIELIQGNLDRGYAIHTQQVLATVPDTCYTELEEPYTCFREEWQTIETPVEIDFHEERRKLRDAQNRLQAMTPGVNAAIAQCRRIYPE